MIRKFILGLIATAVIATPLTLATTAPAQADAGSPKCVTKAEWRKIKVGQTRAKVKQITGINGRVTWSAIDGDGWSTDLDVSYRQCKANGQPASTYNTVYMSFSNYEWDYPENTWHPLSLGYKGSWYSIF